MEIRVTADARLLTSFHARDPLFQNRLVRLDGARAFEFGQRAVLKVRREIHARQREAALGAAGSERDRLLGELARLSRIAAGLERIVGSTLEASEQAMRSVLAAATKSARAAASVDSAT